MPFISRRLQRDNEFFVLVKENHEKIEVTRDYIVVLILMPKIALILHFTALFHGYVVDATSHGRITKLFSIQTSLQLMTLYFIFLRCLYNAYINISCNNNSNESR